MARQISTTAAKTAKRNLVPYTTTALAVVLLAAFLVSEAAAQKAPGPGPVNPGATADVIADAIDYCAWIAEDSVGAEEAMTADGWTIDYSESSGPFVWEINASKIYADGTDAYVFALIETYPTGQIAYCSYDANTLSMQPDITTIGTLYEVDGEYEDYGNGIIYGTWEEINDDSFYFVLANTDVDYFFLQMTVVTAGGLHGGEAAGGSGGK